MSAPNFNGRASRILRWLGDNPQGLTSGEIFLHEKALCPDVKRSQVGASLTQMFDHRKVARHGETHHYVYTLPSKAAPSKPAAKPAQQVKRYASPQARAPKPASIPTVGRKAAPDARKQARDRSFTGLRPRSANTANGPETVEEFLARGGRIQHCAHGETGQSAFGYHQQSAAHKERIRAEVIAKNKAKPRNQFAQNDDDADLDDVA
jgi:hypothetical protein